MEIIKHLNVTVINRVMVRVRFTVKVIIWVRLIDSTKRKSLLLFDIKECCVLLFVLTRTAHCEVKHACAVNWTVLVDTPPEIYIHLKKS